MVSSVAILKKQRRLITAIKINTDCASIKNKNKQKTKIGKKKQICENLKRQASQIFPRKLVHD